MAKIIGVYNQKGGVGKTTSVVNLAAALAMMNRKVLVIDMDPQGNATSAFGISKDRGYLYDGLMDAFDLTDSVIEEVEENVDLIPSNMDMAGIEINLAQLEDWRYNLKEAIKNLIFHYDYIFIDNPPSLGILSLMSLATVDSIIIPVQAEYYSLEGISQLYETINLIKTTINSDLEIEGVLVTMFDGRTNLANEVVKEIEDFFKDKVFTSKIPRNISLAEAPSFGESVIKYAPNSLGAIGYKAVAREILRRNGEIK